MSTPLEKIGLSPERARVAAALLGKSPHHGRRGMPAEAVQRMYFEYQRLGSTYKVAKLFGRSAQAIWEILRRRGFALKPNSKKRRGATRTWKGRVFTRSKFGWRETSGERELLHHLIWNETHGPIPEGHQVSFRNGDFEDLEPENLFCATAAEVTRHHLRRHYPHLKRSPEAQRARRKKLQLASYYRKRKAFWAQGLRSDGKPLTRQLERRGMFAQPDYFPPLPPAPESKAPETAPAPAAEWHRLAAEDLSAAYRAFRAATI